MNKKELDFILQGGEGLTIEFKEGLNNIDKEIDAFANTAGGRIFLGISDNNKIKGIKIDNKIKSQIQDIANNCDPSIKISIEEFESLLIITVEEGEDKPYKCKEGFFIRIGPNSQKMDRNQILEIAAGEGKIRFDEAINKDVNFNKDFDAEKLESFLKKAEITKNMENEEMLINLGAAKKTKKKISLNNTGVLFFAKEPCNIIRQAYVTCIRFQGTENVDIIDRVELREDIISNIENAIKFVKRSTKLSYEIKGLKRKEIPEYPVEAVREAITNAVMHRDYLEKGANVFVSIFDDRLEIYNPGGLPKGLDKKDFGKKGVRRNPLIADLLQRIGYVEKAGTGILRMKKAMKDMGLKEPQIDITGFFTITFYPYRKVGEKYPEKYPEKINKTQEEILSIIKSNPLISRQEIASKLGLSLEAIKKSIATLKAKNILKRKGADKGGHWEVLK